MANTVVNENIFKPLADGTQKFVDLKGLDHFWAKAQAYVDAQDAALAGRITTLEGVVGDDTKGLVMDVKSIQDELNSLSGGAGSIATQINNAITALDLPNTYDAKGAADGALAAAKTYADGLASNYDAAGAADGALAAAKTYTDEQVAGAVGVYASEGVEAAGLRKEIADRDAAVLSEAKTYADGKDAAMDTRVKVLEAFDHDKLAADAAASAVATVVGEAPEAFDTLKEIADWIQKDAANENGFDAAARIVALETGKADKSYVDGLDEAMGTRVKALEDHKDDYAGADATLASTLRGEIATAKGEAISDAVASANGYTDEKVGVLSSTVASNLTEAKSYADGVAATAKGEAIAQAKVDTADALKSYTNTTDMEAAIAAAKAAAIADAQGKIDALSATVALKADKTYVDTQDAEVLASAKAYASTYTDQLFASVTFASDTEIDSIF